MHPAAPSAAQGPRPTWYEVLAVPPIASADAIRSAYRQAALRLHPDKAAAAGAGSGGAGDAPSSNGDGSEAAPSDAADAFTRVQQAWWVLQDGGRRAAYDRELALAEAAADVPIYDTVPLSDASSERHIDGAHCLAWPCRCGGEFLLLAEDAAAAGAGGAPEILVPCCTCSLHLRVLLPVAAPPGPLPL